MKLLRCALYVALAGMLIGLVGCSANGVSGIGIIDQLTGVDTVNGSLRVVTPDTADDATLSGTTDQVTIVITFNQAVNDATLIPNGTVIVTAADGETVNGTIATGATANDAQVTWTSSELFAAGQTFTLSLIGTVAEGAEVNLGVIQDAGGQALDGNGDGLVGGNFVIALDV